MKSAFSLHDYEIVRRVFLEISHSKWFEPGDENSLATYLLHQYEKGHDEVSLKAVSLPFAWEWFCARSERASFD